jgi:radical SAM protein with 4Fe4S-binding SPASM domain
MVERKIQELSWELTSECNLRCKHCFNAVPTKRGVDLNIEEQLKVCDQIINANIKSVQLTGGEILLHEGWIQIASKLIDAGIRVSIITNGVLLNKDLVQKISEAGVSAIGISIEGLQKNNDAIRGCGTYDKVMNAFGLIRNCNTDIPISVNTTITRHNIEDLPELANQLEKRGVTSWMVQLAVPDGNFKKHKNDFMIQPSQMDEIIDCMYEVWKKASMNIFLGDCIGHFNQKEIEVRSTYAQAYGLKSYTEGCGAGKYVAGIKSNGDVVGCISLKDKRYVEGNLKEVQLQDILNNPGSFAWNREIESKKQLAGDCNGCQFGDICKSGCPALKYDDEYNLIENIYCSYNNAIKEERKRISNITDLEILRREYDEAEKGGVSQICSLYLEQIEAVEFSETLEDSPEQEPTKC